MLTTEAQQAILEMKARTNHSVTAAMVLDAARAEDSPLHGLFVWDDTEAAEKYRIIQARGFLRAVVRIIPSAPQGPVRASVRILPNEPRPVPSPSPARGGGGLRTEAEVFEELVQDIARLIGKFERYPVVIALLKGFRAVVLKRAPARSPASGREAA